MKKQILVVMMLGALTFSCKQDKQDKQDHKTKAQENTNKIEKQHITIEELVDENGNVLTAKYNTYEETPTVTLTYKDYKNEKLTQVEAWAKGAEYKNDNLAWIITKEGGDLTVNGEKISFKNK